MDGRDTSLRIGLLGGFRVAAGGRPVDLGAWRLRKSQGIVKLLALAPRHRLHREQLMDVLWPDLDPDAAANQLRKALHRARRALDPDGGEPDRYLVRDGETLTLVGAPLEVDLEAFEDAVAGARRTADVDAYRQAVRIYRGVLLPEDRYDEWVLPTRERLRTEHIACLSELADLLVARAEVDEACEVLRTIVETDPVNEEAHVALMRTYALAGRRPDALAQYEILRDTLDRELGIAPGVATQHLCEEIRAGRRGEPDLADELWEQVGDLRLVAGDSHGAVSAFRSALTGSDEQPGDAARLYRKTAQALLAHHDVTAAAQALDAAELALARAVDERERCRWLAAKAYLHCERGELEPALYAASEGLALAEAHGDEEDVASALDQLAIVAHYRGAWDQGLQVAIEQLGTADTAGTGLLRVFDIHHCISQYHLYGDGLWEGVEEHATRILERATHRGARPAQAFAWCLLGESLLLRGLWDEAGPALERSADLHQQLGDRTGALPWQRLAELAAYRGDRDAADAYLRRGAAIATISPMARHMWGRLYATRAFDAIEHDDPEAALAAVRSASRAAARHGDCPTCSALLHPVAAEAHAQLGNADRAAIHATAAAGITGSFESSGWRAMAEGAEGAVARAAGDDRTAHERWLAAAELYDRAAQPFWAGRSRAQAAEVAPDPDTRRGLRDQALAAFTELGARHAVARLAAVRST